MDAAEKGQVNQSAADIYETFFVPALFAEWAGRLADLADLQSGQRVLDIACGTGVLAREVSVRVGAAGHVVGLDRNEGMLTVARSARPDIEWRLGLAESLPFPDSGFDAVVSQFGLMFFENRTRALSEMWRVLRPGGRLVVAVWADQSETPGYAAMTALLRELFGSEAANALRAPYNLGDAEQLASLFEAAGIRNADITQVEGVARFPSIDSWVHTDVKGWTLADMIDDTQYEQLRDAARNRMQRFVQADGAVRFRHPALITSVSKP